jgi:RIO kinase 1
MRVPEHLQALLDEGVIDEVIRPLQSGKEAQIYMVVARGVPCVAKVYKDAQHRSFKNRADYVEGRVGRNTRDQRAMAKKSRFGRKQAEGAWRSAEVDAIYKLKDAGVRVPEPFDFVEGVLIMELVCNERGEPAPRIADVELEHDDADWVFNRLIGEVIRMLCAGVVHGDLSDFNVLLAPDGPVIIDFPQATDPAHNQSARKLLIRDVDNLVHFFSRWVPEIKDLPLGQEMWDLYERGELTPDSKLTGEWKQKKGPPDVSAILDEIEAAEREARMRREALGLGPPRPARAPVEFDAPPPRPKAGRQGPPPAPHQPGRADQASRRREDDRPPHGERPPAEPRGDRRAPRQGDRRDDPRDDRQAEAPRGRGGRGEEPRGRPFEREERPDARRGASRDERRAFDRDERRDPSRGERRDDPRDDARDERREPQRDDRRERRDPRRDPRDEGRVPRRDDARDDRRDPRRDDPRDDRRDPRREPRDEGRVPRRDDARDDTRDDRRDDTRDDRRDTWRDDRRPTDRGRTGFDTPRAAPDARDPDRRPRASDDPPPTDHRRPRRDRPREDGPRRSDWPTRRSEGRPRRDDEVRDTTPVRPGSMSDDMFLVEDD